ncbi:MAG TPA: hypothetical protein VGI17_07350 [Solirubrobacterales bacterium]
MLVIRYIAWNHSRSEVEERWKMVPAVGWTWCPQAVQVHDWRCCLVA